MLGTVACLYLFRLLPSEAASIPIDGHSIFPRDLDPSDAVDPCSARTVWDILWSCLATTFAVTWVSVHPNVPLLDESDLSVLKRRLFLMLLALIAPEILILWAFKQWRGAVEIRRVVNRARPASMKPWTMAHAHFLQMGGFRLVCTEDENAKGLFECALSEKADFMGMGLGRRVKAWGRFFIPYYLSFRSPCPPPSLSSSPRDHPQFVEGALLFESFIALLEDGRMRFPADVSEEDIKDKSKGDALSKGFALLQISWFVLQIVARACAREGMGVTELELTTAVLAGMNAVTYFFWWDKPVDVRRPVVLRTREVEEVMFGIGNGNAGVRGVNDEDAKNEDEDAEVEDAEVEDEEVEQEVEQGAGQEHVCGSYPEEMEARTSSKGSWKACILTASKSVCSTLISIPGYVAQEVSDGTRSTVRSLRSASSTVFSPRKWLPSPARPPRAPLPLPTNSPRNRPLNPRMKLSPLGKTLLTLERVLHPVAYPLRLLIAMPANTLLAHGLWNIVPTDDRGPAREFYLSKTLSKSKSQSEGRAKSHPFAFEAKGAGEGEGEMETGGDYADAREKYHGKSARDMMWDESDMRWVMHMIFLSTSSSTTSDSDSGSTGQRRLFYAGAAAGTLFGSLHCIAWAFPFPSTAERVIWRTAALLIVALSLSVVAGARAYQFAYGAYWGGAGSAGFGTGRERGRDRKNKDKNKNNLDRDPGPGRTKRYLVGMLLLKKLAGVPCVLYPLARVVLLVIALTSLRDLPESALRTVQWTRFIPHV